MELRVFYQPLLPDSDQLPAFEAEMERQHQEYLNKLAALKASGASKEKIELAKIAIED